LRAESFFSLVDGCLNEPLSISPRTTRCSTITVRHLLPAQLGGARRVIGNAFCVTGTGLSHQTQKKSPGRQQNGQGSALPRRCRTGIRRAIVARRRLAIG
jgi:hypothetical protein